MITLHIRLFLLVSVLWLAPFVMATPHKQAILLGSSGLVGGMILDELLQSPIWDKIHVVVRKPLSKEHAKLHQIVISDLTSIPTNHELQALAAAAANDEANHSIHAAIITVGVSEPWKLPSVQDFVDVDVTIPQLFADYCAQHFGVPYVSLLSGVDAERNPEPFSREELQKPTSLWNVMFLYFMRVKGLTEQAMIDSGIPNVALFEPCNFETDEYRFGWLDVVGQALLKVFNPILPSKYHSIHVNDLVHAMVRHVEQFAKKGEPWQAPPKQVVTRLTYLDMMKFRKDEQSTDSSSEL